MSPSKKVPFVKSIFHPSDFSGASDVAFAHALALAVKGKCALTILHAGGGRVADAILDAASRNVDLIIMTTEGRHGIVDAFRGSVTERIVRGAPCPVLVVPEK